MGVAMLITGAAGAEESSEVEKALHQQLEQSTAFTKAWVSDLMQIMDAELDSMDVATILEACGSACAERNSAPLLTAYANNLDGLLAKMKELWLESVEHDAERKVITLIGRKSEKCPCPIHPTDNAHSFCECSNGHMKRLFSVATGSSVGVELIESVLRGGERCSWRLSYSLRQN
jgi:hypothetical protein